VPTAGRNLVSREERYGPGHTIDKRSLLFADKRLL